MGFSRSWDLLTFPAKKLSSPCLFDATYIVIQVFVLFGVISVSWVAAIAPGALLPQIAAALAGYATNTGLLRVGQHALGLFGLLGPYILHLSINFGFWLCLGCSC